MPWTTESDAVRAAVRDPDLAAVLAVSEAVATATVAQDAAAFAAGHAADCIVNSPANRVITGAQAEQAFAAGMIDYHSLDRRIDHVARLPEGLVVVMGEETAIPRGRAHHAGKTIRRRFTDLWRQVDGGWRLTVRQATVIAVE